MITHRLLGSTGMQVSRIGLGLAALGRPAYITDGRTRDLGDDRSIAAMERRTHEVLDAAFAEGVRYFDAARSYGHAEAFLRSWLQDRRIPLPSRGSALDVPVVGSKWGYTYTGDWRMDAPVQERKELSAETLTRQAAESRSILGAHLRLYQIHSATIESGVFADARVLSALARLREDGLAVGFTTTGPQQAETIRRAMAVTVDGAALFQVVQSTWNVLEPSSGAALAEAHAEGLGVIVKEALANGRLAAQDDVAIATALRQPWADVVLSGAVTVDQLHSNLRALNLTRTAEADAPRVSAEPPEVYWSTRASRRWA